MQCYFVINTMWPPWMKQTWICSGALIIKSAHTMSVPYISCLMQGLTAPESTIKVDILSLSWLSSIIGISMAFGICPAATFMQWTGRRRYLLFMQVLTAAGWALTYCARSYIELMIARFIKGFTMASSFVIVSTVLGEYSNPQSRGVMLTLKAAFTCISSTIIHSLGILYHWRTVALFIGILNAVCIIQIITWPESPSWLIYKNRFKEAEDIFFWLRGVDDSTVKEFESMIRAQKERNKHKTQTKTVTDYVHKFLRKEVLKPVVIVTVSFVLLEVGGRHTIPSYLPNIVKKITADQATASTYTIATDILSIVASLTTGVFIKMWDRRTVLFSSGISSLTILLFFCSYLFLSSKELLPTGMTWIPLSLFAVYFFLFNTGCSAIPFVLYGEIFPLEDKGFTAAVCGINFSLLLFLSSKLLILALDSMAVHTTFALCGLISAVCLVILYFILPETWKKTLQEIEDIFSGRKEEVVLIPNDGRLESHSSEFTSVRE